MAQRVHYEAGAFPEDSTPAWTRTFAGAPVRSVAGSIFDDDVPLGGDSDAYAIDVPAFNAGQLDLRMAVVASIDIAGAFIGWVIGANGVQIHVSTAGIALRVGSGGADEVFLALDYDAGVFHTYKLKWSIAGSGLPRATLTDDRGNSAEKTATVAFTPNRIQFQMQNSFGQTRTQYDYLRFLVGSSGENRVPRIERRGPL